jgi:hypothetical protein
MRVLVACECFGVVRDAFIARGHDAWSCDLKPTETPGPHIQQDILEVIGGGRMGFNDRSSRLHIPLQQRHSLELSYARQSALIPQGDRVCRSVVGCADTKDLHREPGRLLGELQQFDGTSAVHSALRVWSRRKQEDRALAEGFAAAALRSGVVCSAAHSQRQAAMGKPDRQRSEQRNAERTSIG